jgi:8-oxo-dGTP pyrophosphatase MutT (NUDIX family)
LFFIFYVFPREWSKTTFCTKPPSGATYPSTLSHLNISPPDLLPTIPSVTYLAVGAFLFRKSQLTDAPPTLLLIRRSIGELSFPGLWEIPGGGVESYETILDAVVREVKEETGLVVGKITQCYDVNNSKGRRSGSAIRKWQFEVEIEGEGEEVVVLDPSRARRISLGSGGGGSRTSDNDGGA